MGAIAAVIVALGIVALIWSIMERVKAQRVTKTAFLKTGDAAAQTAGGAVSSEGNVICTQPLVAPFSGAQCLYYDIKCTAEWKDGDQQRSKEIAHQKAAAAFAIDDGSGAVSIDASQGGSFEPTQSKRETKGTGLLGGITGKDLMFGQYVVSTGALAMGTKYTVVEEVLAILPRLYVAGRAAGGAIAAPGGLRSLLISSKPREVLLASALKGAKLSMIGGLSAIGVGGALGVLSIVMAPSAEAKPAAAVASPVSSPIAAIQPAAPAPVATANTTAVRLDPTRQPTAPAKATPVSATSAKPVPTGIAAASSAAAAAPSANPKPATSSAKPSSSK